MKMKKRDNILQYSAEHLIHTKIPKSSPVFEFENMDKKLKKIRKELFGK